MSFRRDWDRWEDDELRKRYRTETAASIGRELGRTARSVVARAESLGLRKQPRFGEELDALIREKHAAGWSDCEIAAQVGCDSTSICKRRRKLGLKSNRTNARVLERIRDRASVGYRAWLKRRGVSNPVAFRIERHRQLARESGWPEGLLPRSVAILNLLRDRGPLTRKEIVAGLDLPAETLTDLAAALRTSRPGRSHLVHLVEAGLIEKDCGVRPGAGGHACDLYRLTASARRRADDLRFQTAERNDVIMAVHPTELNNDREASRAIAGELVTTSPAGQVPPADQAPPTPPWMTHLRSALNSPAAVEKLKLAIDAQLEKAAKGDVRALQFILDLNGKHQPPTTQNLQQNNVVFNITLPSDTAPEDAADPVRTKAYAVLEAYGELTLGQLEAHVGVSGDRLRQAIDHSWFERRASSNGRGTVYALRRGSSARARRGA